MPDDDAWKWGLEVELESGHGGHEAGERDEPRGPWPSLAEPERVRHYRTLREPSEHDPLAREAALGSDVVEPRRGHRERLRERHRIRVADLLDGVPVRSPRGKVEWPAWGDGEEPAFGIEEIEQRKEVALVGSAAVEQREQSFRFRRRAGGPDT